MGSHNKKRMDELEKLKAENAKLKQEISFIQDKEDKTQEGEKTITVDECLIDIIKDMNAIVKAERAKIEKFRERDHQHYQESVDELHTHYKEQMDNIQDEAKKQIKDIEGKYMEAFEDRMSEVKEHYETEREGLVSKFNELKDMLQEERKETDSLRKKIRSMQQ